MSISASEPDWSREQPDGGGWAPNKALLKAIRDYQRAKGTGLGAKLAVLRHRFWSMVTGADIPLNCKIGGGLLIAHPNGFVIHPDPELSPNCLLFKQVTLGHAEAGVSYAQGGVPKLGGYVDVGAGARLIGPTTIGDHARIGANAVVTRDVPAGATAIRIPARIVGGDGNG